MDTYENDAETGSDALDPEDFPNKRSYQAAVRLADDLCFNETDEDLCRFILNQADTVTAAKYITQYGKFLFSQAIKDNFDLPCNLPDEDEEPEMTLSDIVNKISRYDCALAARVWAWCLETFGSYTKYWEHGSYHLTHGVLDWLSRAQNSEALKSAVVLLMCQDPQFCKNLVLFDNCCPTSLSEVIVTALREKQYRVAEQLFVMSIEKEGQKWNEINDLIQFILYACKREDHTDPVIYFRDHLFPHVRTLKDGMVLDEIPVFEEKMAELINESDGGTDAFAQGIRAAIEGAVSSLNTTLKETSSKKAEADTTIVTEGDLPDVGPEYEQDVQAKAQKRVTRQNEADALIEAYEDKRVYTFCNVMLRVGSKAYCYLTDDATIKLGDRVVVEVGNDNKEETGTVVSVGQYLRYAAPYPIEKTKKILRKIEPQNK